MFAYDVELERVEVFKYLGRLIAYDNEDTQAVRGNLKKARRLNDDFTRFEGGKRVPLSMWNVLQGDLSIRVVVWE